MNMRISFIVLIAYSISLSAAEEGKTLKDGKKHEVSFEDEGYQAERIAHNLLRKAIENGKFDELQSQLQVFLHKKGNIDKRSWDGNTLLHVAAQKSSEIVQLLIESNAGVTAYNRQRQTALTIARLTNNQAVVDLLMKIPKARDQLLEQSVEADDMVCARSCLEAKADLYHARCEVILPPLSCVKSVPMAKLLLEHKAETDESYSHLSYHISNNRTGVVLFLLEQKASPNPCMGALHGAKSMEMAQFLLERKSDPNGRGAWGFFPLHAIAERSSYNSEDSQIIKLLVEHKAAVNALTNYQDGKPTTALHFALGRQNKDAARALIEAKADIYLQDDWGKSALDRLVENCALKVDRAMLAAKADVYAKDIFGKSALDRLLENFKLP